MDTRRSCLVAAMVSIALSACSGPSAPPVEVSTPPATPANDGASAPEIPAESSASGVGPSSEANAAAVGVNQELSVDPFVGHYATEDYARRGEGYDWVAVAIEKIDDHSAYVKVRSRGDKKRPTCSFDGVGTPVDGSTLEVRVDAHPLRFTLAGDTLTAAVTVEDDRYLLSYFCSGGATLEGPFLRISEPLDAAQVAQEAYSTTLSLQQVTFQITANDSLPRATVVIRPEGLTEDSRLVVTEVEGMVTGAEINDLNSDGWPEFFIYSRGIEPGAAGGIIGYSVNGGKSMSAIAIPALSEEARIGYRGGDEFTIVETSLARRFRVYRDGDPDGAPTGPMRQLTYHLTEGENARTLTLASMTEIELS